MIGHRGASQFAVVIVIASGHLRAATPLACSATSVSRQVRYEGMSELVGDVVLTCTGGTPTPSATQIPTADITLTFNANVTSRLLDPSGATAVSEALLLIDEPGSGLPAPAPGFGPGATQILCSSPLGAAPGGCVEYAQTVGSGTGGGSVLVAASSPSGPAAPGANVFQGIVNGSQVMFHAIPLLAPASGSTRILRITNVRVNASGMSGAGTGAVTGTVSISGGVTVNVSNNPQTVANATAGLTASGQNAANSGALAAGGTSFSQCTGSSSPVAVSTLQFRENFTSAFLPRVAPTTTYNGQSGAPTQNVPGSIYNSESGFVFPAASNGAVVAGLADYGTRLKATFNNIPTGVRIFVSVTNLASNTSSANTSAPSGNSTSAFAELVQSESAVDANGLPPVTISTTSVNGTPPTTNLAELLVVNGSATAVWEVINTDPAASGTFQFGVWQQFTANGPPPGTATVTLSFAPTFSASAGSGPSSTLPIGRFAAAASPVNLLSISACTGTKADSTTILTPSLVSTTPGQPVTLTATVSPSSASGSVVFYDGSTALGSATLSNGSASLTANFAAGIHTLTATYGGNGNFNVSTSLPVTVNVGTGKTATQIGVTSTPNPAGAGQPVMLSAVVTPSGATGSITFHDGSVTLGTATMTAGSAGMSTSGLSAGSHSITASYSGDANYYGNTSSAFNETINAGGNQPSTSLTATPNPAAVGQTVVLTAAVLPASATGSIAFKDGGTAIGTANITNGSATFSTSSLTAGSHSLTASYSGDSSNAASTSSAVTEVINPATATATTTSLSVAPGSVTTGQPVTLTATVTPSAATGLVTFKDGTAIIGYASLSSGSASFTTSTLPAGSHSLSASYNGSSAYSSSTSNTVTLSVSGASGSVVLTASPNPAAFGQAVTLTIAVTPASATGTVTVIDTSTGTYLGPETLSGGGATITSSALKVGSHLLQANYSGDSNNPSSTSAVVTETVSQAATVTILTALPASSVPGQTVVLTATVSPSAATGNVVFNDGVLTLSTTPLANGTATLSISALAAGTHNLTASYGGDGNYAASNSTTVTETIGAAAPCATFPAGFVPFTSVSSFTQPNTAGDLAVVGSMTSSNYATYQGLPLPVAPNQQFCGTVLLAPGVPVTAYVPTAAERGGDFSAFAGLLIDPLANGGAFPGGVIPSSRIPATLAWRIASVLQTSATTLTVTPTSSTPGQSVTLTAAVTPSTASGSVTFQDGTTSIGSVPLNAGTATLTTSALSAGVHVLTAAYGGDARTAASISNSATETVGASAAITTTTLIVAPVSSTVGQNVTLTAAVTPSSATGSVTFKDGSLALGTAQLVSGTAVWSTSALLAGTHSLTASYAGDAKDVASTSNTVTATVAPAASTTTAIVLTVAPTSSTPGQNVTMTAAVTPSTATGTVTFQDGSTALGTVPLASGSAVFMTSTLPAGTHTLTAWYSGDARNGASTSIAVTATVAPPASTTTTVLTVNPVSPATSQNVTLTATVTPSTATGNVTFQDGTANLGAAPLNSGVAVFMTSTLAAGAHSLTASYGGDAKNAASTSAAVTATVGSSLSTTTTALTVNPASSTAGQNVTLTATVTPSTATGNVTFQDGSTSLGVAPLNSGIAVFITTSLAAGTHTLTASYGGDTKNAASTSNAVTETVGPSSAATTIALTVNPTSSTTGQNVTLTATVSPSSATGTVTFQDGTTNLGVAPLNSGTAVFMTATLAAGAHPLSASYSGDAKYSASSSTTVTETVTASPASSTTTLTVTPTSSTAGQSVTLSATVAPSSATGTVSFKDGSALLGTSPLNSGSAVFTISTLAAGVHSLSASYGGDTRYAPSTSSTVTETVVSANPVQIVSPAAPVTAFAGVQFSQTFQASGGTPPYKWTMPSNTMRDLSITAYGNTAIVSGTPQAAGSYQFSVQAQDSGSQSATTPVNFPVYPPLSFTITAPQPSTPADQPAPQLTLSQSYPFPMTATFTLSFVANAPGLPAAYNDVQFPDGTTRFAVSIPPNSTTPSPPIPSIQIGSVAGDIIGTLGPVMIPGTAQVLPLSGAEPGVKMTLPAMAPVIVPGSVKITNVASSGFQVFLDTGSTTRDLVSGTFVFTAAPGTQMNGCTPNCTVKFGPDAAAWFASADGIANGGNASLAVPFTFSGDTSVIGTVSVTLTNSAGTSTAVSGGR
ncbi:MAG TPA: Ig-like domain-containing protein [Bryobacteraceae bacterium]|nr:Ig-like domain-containing protein [Bryobacteraceae bacterium]